MKSGIHPTYHTAKIQCACGATFEIGSTTEGYHVDICSQCHPFYTGKQKLVDTAGRVDKFRARMEAAEKLKAADEVRQSKKTKKESVEEKMTRKAQEKEEAKEVEKAEKEAVKKEIAKKKAEKLVINQEPSSEQVTEIPEKKGKPKKAAKKK